MLSWSRSAPLEDSQEFNENTLRCFTREYFVLAETIMNKMPSY